jgi:signal peptidase I
MSWWVVVAAVAGLAGLGALRRTLTMVTVAGTSMTPTLADGQRVLAVRCRRYRTGDVIVFRAPGPPVVAGDPAWRVKRIAAVGHEPVPPWLSDWVTVARVPAGAVVVSGDNARSQDSRQLGFVPVRSIAGRVAGVGRPAPAAAARLRATAGEQGP